MGNNCDALMWPDNFCAMLTMHNLHVVRFDQRDTGLSTKINFELANGYKTPFDRDFFYTLFKNFLFRLESSTTSNSSIGHKSNHDLATSKTPVITQQELHSLL
jgi:hypothetical protein